MASGIAGDIQRLIDLALYVHTKKSYSDCRRNVNALTETREIRHAYA